MKSITLIILLLSCGLGAWADNNIALASVQGAPGAEVTISVSMTNSDAVSALQISIPLDDNLTFVENSQKAGSRLTGHTLYAGVNNKVLNIMIYSNSMDAINGNEGEICTFKLLLGNAPGIISLTPSKIGLMDNNGSPLVASVSVGMVEIRGAKAQFTKNILSFGKVAINGSSNQPIMVRNVGNEPLVITNITLSSSFFSTTTTLPLTVNAGSSEYINVNCSPTARGTIDEEMVITSNSVSGQNTIRLTAMPYGVNELSLGNVTGMVDEEVTIQVSIKNYDAISGLQMEIQMPNELEYVNGSFELSDRKQDHVSYASITDGILRILAYSPNDKAFTGSDGEVGSFKVKIVGSSNVSLNISNAKLVTTIDGKSEDVLSAKYGCTISVKSPSIYTFGSIIFNRLSITEQNVQKSYSIYNYGSAPLTISNIVFANGLFSVSETFPITIQPSSSKSITVVCQATEAGDISTNMEIYSNDPNRRLYIVKVNGSIFTPDNMTASVEGLKNNVDLSISLDNYSDIYGIQFDINSDQEYTASAEAVSLSDRAGNLSVSINAIAQGKLRVVAYSNNDQFIASGQGKVMTIKLVPKETLQEGDYVLTLDNIVLGDKYMKNKYEGSSQLTVSFSPQSIMLGDVNDDGDVDIADAVCVVNYIVGKVRPVFIEAAADVNHDGDIDIADAVHIVNLIVGKIDAFARQRDVTLPEAE